VKRRSPQKPQSGAARSPRSSRASARQNRVVHVLPLRLRRLRIRARGGEHLDEPGDRGERRVVVRPEGSTGARARQRRRRSRQHSRPRDPRDERPELPRAGSGSNRAVGATAAARPVKPRARREAAAPQRVRTASWMCCLFWFRCLRHPSVRQRATGRAGRPRVERALVVRAEGSTSPRAWQPRFATPAPRAPTRATDEQLETPRRDPTRSGRVGATASARSAKLSLVAKQPRAARSQSRVVPVYLKLMFSVESAHGSMAPTRTVLALGGYELGVTAACT
jgi:hypothetical protein